MNDTIKTEAPVLHPIAVSEPWSVLCMDLIGPLPTTPSGYKYALTMTDLFTKWVIAEPLRNKSAADVATAVVNKLFDFGLVDKIITDQGREFVNEVNEGIFNTLGVKQCISSAYHPQTNGQDERTNQTLKRALAKYTNETQNDWGSHLKAVVYAINTSEQSSTRYTPHFSMFCRHPKMPEALNSSPIGEDFVIGDVAENMDNRIEQVKALHAEVLTNIEKAQKKDEAILSRIYEEETDEQYPLVRISDCQATLQDLKSLCHPQNDFPWLTDAVVDARLAQLAAEAEEVRALPAHTFVSWWRMWNQHSQIDVSVLSCLKVVGHDTPETGNHFILWVLDGPSEQIRVYDSMGIHTGIQSEDLDLLSNAFRDVWDLRCWTISYPSQWLQTDGQNCGVFVCTMAELEARGIMVETETPQCSILGYLRQYHATCLAVYAITHMTYKSSIAKS
ncbi:hypothetical protein MATL_G00175990 [Megalops atlanticus]|uniref:Integrase catalytic domain-containing protein n=1 Tax=Megalops atlanticus TaxID=7932 RepID=A0A9D3PQH0_MEGAT|nr:hypothetical protein MATL_G00175990 [Megalops atlanticus]